MSQWHVILKCLYLASMATKSHGQSSFEMPRASTFIHPTSTLPDSFLIPHNSLIFSKLLNIGTLFWATVCLAQLCNKHGKFLENGAPPPAQVDDPQNWFPYDSQLQFETAEFLYTKCQMLASKIDALLDLWASSLYPHGAQPPFVNHHQLYDIIDSTKLGSDIKWQCLSASYMGEVPTVDLPQWMSQKYDIWYCDPHLVAHQILRNSTMVSDIDLHPFQEYSTDNQEWHYKDFMSGEWVWEQAVCKKNDLWLVQLK